MQGSLDSGSVLDHLSNCFSVVVVCMCVWRTSVHTRSRLCAYVIVYVLMYVCMYLCLHAVVCGVCVCVCVCERERERQRERENKGVCNCDCCFCQLDSLQVCQKIIVLCTVQ